jgi:HK97 family phage major capsid protein
MTKLELQDAKTKLLAANEELEKNIDAEKRSMTPEESEDYQVRLAKIREYDLRLVGASQRAGEVGIQVTVKHNEPPKEKFSFMKSINAVVNHQQLPEATRDLSILAEREFSKAGGDVRIIGSFQIPAEVRADITAGTATQGQEIVSEEKKAILPPLVNKLVLVQAGATFLTGLKGTVSIPSYSGTSAAWVTEVEAETEGNGTFAEVLFVPKRACAIVEVSKLFLAQDTVGAEAMLMDNISNAIARLLESSILGKAPLEADYPQGMGARITTVGATKPVVTPTYANIVALETNVDTANALAGNLAYITNSAGRGILKTTVQGPSGVGRMLLEDGEMNGYPVYVTNAASTSVGAGSSGNLLVFGNWADLCICQWGGYDITVDPYTLAHKGQVRLVINCYFDAKGLRGKASGGVSGYDYYTKSFDELGIVV